jgi:hypothetical protein
MRSALQQAMIVTGIWALLLTGMALFLPMEPLATVYLLLDEPVGLTIGAALIALGLWRGVSSARTARWVSERAAVRALILMVGVIALAGTWLVFRDYALSRDEVLADFAAQHFRAGVLLPPVPPPWQPYAEALQPGLMAKVPGDRFWLSGYLPGNSLLRAMLGPATGPLLAMLACLAVYRVGRLLWPDERGPALVALVLLATSAQFLVNAMTPYAMTAHLAFNALWLWLFLRNDRFSDIAALAVGWLACGLHQIIFHPLFVAPFIIRLWLGGEKRRFAIYVLAYAAIGLFWIFYWQMLLHLLGGSLPDNGGEAGNGAASILNRAGGLIKQFNLFDVWLMMANLVRFLTWQNLILVPLAILSWPAIRANEGIARPLAIGILLLFAMVFVLMPFQAFGWGYRYFHGILGSFSLLAAYGWRTAVREGRNQALGSLYVGTAVTLLFVIPWQMVQAYRFVTPYRTAYQRLIATPTDVVLLDDAGLFFAGDLVRNRWDLSNRPLTMELGKLDEPSLRALCRNRHVALFGQRDGIAAGIRTNAEIPNGPSARNRQLLKEIGCAGQRLP